MPFGKWQDFDACVSDYKAQGKDEDSAKKICGALQAKLGKESFSWTGDIKPGEGSLIKGTAIHPCKTVHPEEWPVTRVYLEEELQKAAHSLSGMPLSLDHLSPLNGKVISTQYEDGAIEYVAELNDPLVLGWIRDGTIKHCSVEYDWGSLSKLNGVAPRDISFQGLALLKDFEPGDPATSVEVWEALAARLKEAKKVNEQIAGLQSRVDTLTNEKRALGEKVEALEKEKGDLVKRLGEAVIDPSAKRITDPVSRKAVLALLEGVVPPKQIIFSHGRASGFRQLVNDVLSIMRRIEGGELGGS